MRSLWPLLAVAVAVALSTPLAAQIAGPRIPPPREGTCEIALLPNSHVDIQCQAGEYGEQGNISLKWDIPPDHPEYQKWKKLVGTRTCLIGLPVGIRC